MGEDLSVWTDPAWQAYRDQHWRLRRRLERTARLLDSVVRLPVLGWRVGLDAPLNLIPGVGLVTTTGLSTWLILEAARLGATRGLCARMAGNVLIDAAISAVPVVGWLGDMFFRANDRNVKLLSGHLDAGHPFRRPQRGPGGVVDGTAERL
ncbi:DUF4112 domain-containing protein [Niveispirillum fermenti]|uniref:DUF4112 domain-containing protein n=1 Tax=Niveispirillum fermenti TaxID=1233113 RepID=UPI003A8AC2E1